MNPDPRLSFVPKKLREVSQQIDSLEWEGEKVPESLYKEKETLEKLSYEGVLYAPNF